MSCFIDICLLCLNKKSDLKLVKPKNTDDIVNKLKYCFPEYDLNSDISEHICDGCENNLNNFYEFKQKCLQNMTTYKKYAQQVTTTDSSNKYLNENNYDTSYLESQTGTNIEIVNIEESLIKKESDELVMTEEQTSLLCEIKQENLEPDDSCLETNSDKIHDSTQNTIFACKVCNKSFKHLPSLRRHKLIHTSEKPFACKVCNKSFQRSDILKKHELVHTGEKPFTCEVCNKSFRQSAHFKKHELIHTGVKSYTCEICSKSFNHLATLKEHKLVHTGEKPFTCEVCSESFRQSANFRKHKLTHTGVKSYSCEICNKTFVLLSLLKRHKLVHTSNKPFTCEVCNKSFKLQQTLKYHKPTHASKEPSSCKF